MNDSLCTIDGNTAVCGGLTRDDRAGCCHWFPDSCFEVADCMYFMDARVCGNVWARKSARRSLSTARDRDPSAAKPADSDTTG
jgi:hypothetical protein